MTRLDGQLESNTPPSRCCPPRPDCDHKSDEVDARLLDQIADLRRNRFEGVETSVPVYFARFYLVSCPRSTNDDPRLKWGPEEELAVSAADGIGLNSVTSEHRAHVVLELFNSEADVPALVRRQQPQYWFTSSGSEVAITDTEGGIAIVAPTPGLGRITCVVECTGREDTVNARHHEQRSEIRDVERWHITAWPEPQ